MPATLPDVSKAACERRIARNKFNDWVDKWSDMVSASRGPTVSVYRGTTPEARKRIASGMLRWSGQQLYSVSDYYDCRNQVGFDGSQIVMFHVDGLKGHVTIQ